MSNTNEQRSRSDLCERVIRRKATETEGLVLQITELSSFFEKIPPMQSKQSLRDRSHSGNSACISFPYRKLINGYEAKQQPRIYTCRSGSSWEVPLLTTQRQHCILLLFVCWFVHQRTVCKG